MLRRGENYKPRHCAYIDWGATAVDGKLPCLCATCHLEGLKDAISSNNLLVTQQLADMSYVDKKTGAKHLMILARQMGAEPTCDICDKNLLDLYEEMYLTNNSKELLCT